MAKTSGPEWYALADGRQFYEWQRETLLPICKTFSLSVWGTHCVLSASEHFFRAGAKAGETITDFQSIAFWIAWAPESEDADVDIVWSRIQTLVADERKKVGR